jgi:hypothetical protein
MLVLVVDTARRPLSPCHPARACWLLTAGKAAVWRRDPFTIILKRAVPEAQPQLLRLTLDPGSRTTGLALVHEASRQVVWAAELVHRGLRMQAALLVRTALRRSRRQRHTRYRPRRFANRRRPEGWLPPSLHSWVRNVLTWMARLRRYAPVGALSQELMRSDTRLLDTPAISAVAYQKGELAGYEVREDLLEQFRRRCAYCGATAVPDSREIRNDFLITCSAAGDPHGVAGARSGSRPRALIPCGYQWLSEAGNMSLTLRTGLRPMGPPANRLKR